MNTYTIYLAGPINSCTDAECKDWRKDARTYFESHEVAAEIGEIKILDPMRRDYRGQEMTPGVRHLIVKGDKTDYRSADILLVYSPKPSYGTSMEIFDAFENLKKWVVIVNDDKFASPWLEEHCDIRVPDFTEAFKAVTRIIKEMESK
jgi:hypothetical protein